MLVNPVGLAPLLPAGTMLARGEATDHRAPTHDPATCPVCARQSGASDRAVAPRAPVAAATEVAARSSISSTPPASTGVVWTSWLATGEAGAAEPNRPALVTRRQREDTQRRVARAYDAEPHARLAEALAPRGLPEPAGPPGSRLTEPAAEGDGAAAAVPRTVLVVATAADLRALHKAIVRASAAPAPRVRHLSLVA